MKTTFRQVAVLALFSFFSTCFAQEKKSEIISHTPHELEVLGEKFGKEVQENYKDMSNAAAQRYYDLMPICQKYFPVGTSFTDATTILKAAGALPDKVHNSIWVPAYNRSLPANSIDRNDVAAGFLLAKTLISHAQFGIFLRPQSTMDSTSGTIGKIIACRVLEVSL